MHRAIIANFNKDERFLSAASPLQPAEESLRSRSRWHYLTSFTFYVPCLSRSGDCWQYRGTQCSFSVHDKASSVLKKPRYKRTFMYRANRPLPLHHFFINYKNTFIVVYPITVTDHSWNVNFIHFPIKRHLSM